MTIFFGDFTCVALNLEKVGPIFHVLIHIRPCHPFVKDDREQFQCLNIVSENKTGPLFLEFNCWKIVLVFLKI